MNVCGIPHRGRFVGVLGTGPLSRLQQSCHGLGEVGINGLHKLKKSTDLKYVLGLWSGYILPITKQVY